MKLKVVFSQDPTGFQQDIQQIITIPVNTCLYCYLTPYLFEEEIKKELNKLGYSKISYYFNLLKVYAI